KKQHVGSNLFHTLTLKNLKTQQCQTFFHPKSCVFNITSVNCGLVIKEMDIGDNVSNKIYRTVSHVDGWNGLPQYEIRGNKIYRTVSHVDGWNGLPQYEIRGNKIYTTVSHVNGWNSLPQYEIR
ncbi:TPA: hypothetical protein ACG5U3_004195, partial [Escherichia coli]